jgi:Pyruvate/2-oxoacid:ferredoxin oxidoreductase gamma subunit
VEAGAVDPARRSVLIPLNAVADGRIKNPKLGNMVALGALLRATGCLEPGAVREVLERTAPAKRSDILAQNLEALEAGYRFVG